MKRFLSFFLASVLVLALAACGGKTEQENSDPVGPVEEVSGEVVKIICPYGVGGTADVVARKYADVANVIQSDYHFVVENMTGGDGFAAAQFFTGEDPAEHDILVLSYGVCYRHDLGKKYDTEDVEFDRAKFSPIGSIDDRTWVLYTTPGQDLAGILEKARTTGIKMSGGNPLSDPHLAFGSLIAQEGGKVAVVPYDGGAAQKQGLIDGEVDVFVGTTQVGQEEVKAGTLVPVLAFSEQPFEELEGPNGLLSVPPVAGEKKASELNAENDYLSSILPAGSILATHTGGDAAFRAQMIQITKDVWNEAEFHDWIASILLNRFEIYGDEAAAYIDEACDKSMAAYERMSAG